MADRIATDPITRRWFLEGAARTLLGVAAVPLLSRRAAAQDGVRLRPATARRVIQIYVGGGLSHLDTFDPKPGTPEQGPTEAVATNADGIRIASHFRHLRDHMDKVAVLRSLTSTQGAHAQARYFLHTGYELRGTIRHPTLGAWLDALAGPINPALPGHVAIAGGQYTADAGFLGPRHDPLPIGDPEAGLQDSTRHRSVDEQRFAERLERLRRMNAEFAERHPVRDVRAYDDAYEQAVRLMGSRDLEAFDVTREPEYLREAYGDDRFGQGCLLARRLVEHGVRFVEVVTGGYDTHNENFDELAEKLPALDRGLAALLADLEARGLLEDTLVAVVTEFGRTPRINSRNGRDHHPKAFCALLAGGGVRGGRAYGATDERGDEVVEGRMTIPDLNATIAYALGLPLDHVAHSPSGRPFTVADKGRAVRELFA